MAEYEIKKDAVRTKIYYGTNERFCVQIPNHVFGWLVTEISAPIHANNRRSLDAVKQLKRRNNTLATENAELTRRVAALEVERAQMLDIAKHIQRTEMYGYIDDMVEVMSKPLGSGYENVTAPADAPICATCGDTRIILQLGEVADGEFEPHPIDCPACVVQPLDDSEVDAKTNEYENAVVDSVHALVRSRLFNKNIQYTDYEETKNGSQFNIDPVDAIRLYSADLAFDILEETAPDTMRVEVIKVYIPQTSEDADA